MYNPKERLHQFVPSKKQRVDRAEISEPVPKQRTGPSKTGPPKKAKKAVFMHVVDVDQLYNEFEQPDHSKTIRDLCELLESKGRMTFLGEAKTPHLATTMAGKFGTGNLMVYAVVHGPNDLPLYLALGQTAGCRVDGTKVYGAFDVLTAFGGRANPFTLTATEHYSLHIPGYNEYEKELRWDVAPRRPIWKLLKRGFVKPYIQKFHQVYLELEDPDKVVETIQRYPVDARGVLLMRLLFSSSEVASHAFLQVFQ